MPNTTPFGSTDCKDIAGYQSCYCIVHNIPAEWRSKHLRIYFANFIEQHRFMCFHFRHRPEVKLRKTTRSLDTELDAPVACTSHSIQAGTPRPTSCCIVRLTLDNRRRLIAEYHREEWSGIQPALGRCYIKPFKLVKSTPAQDAIKDETGQIPEPETGVSSVDHVKLMDAGDDELVTAVDGWPELQPPTLMPNGNVGTPTAVFLELIKTCRLPSKVIKSLGLTFPKNSKRRAYTKVPHDYGQGNPWYRERNRTTERPVDASERAARTRAAAGYSVPHETPEDCGGMSEHWDCGQEPQLEEWERHEQLHDDVTSQERIKPRLFEEEQEVVWDKGGPGLVFFTDDVFWESLRTKDTDERWADDWDVDMSVYDDPRAGDRDSREIVQIRREQFLRDGNLTESVFNGDSSSSKGRYRRKSFSDDPEPGCGDGNNDDVIGRFERHSTGFASRLMRQQGWVPGRGLGALADGRAIALSAEGGQHPKTRIGFGYRGERMQRFGLKRPGGKDLGNHHIIGSVFDPVQSRENGVDREGESLAKRPDMGVMKRRCNEK